MKADDSVYRSFNFEHMSNEDIELEISISKDALSDLYGSLEKSDNHEVLDLLIGKWKARVSVLESVQLERAIASS